MGTPFLEWICHCINSANSLSHRDVLRQLEMHTVCVGTQCFDSEESAFGLTVPSSHGSFVPLAVTGLLLMAACVLHQLAVQDGAATHKPDTIQPC